jgi:phosphoglycerol transferase MdoB-like AlkP superfamily enzyme
MKNYLYHIQLFIQRLLLLLFVFSATRVIFYFFNHNYFGDIQFFHFVKIIIAGVRFDISAIFYANLLFILLSLIPGEFKNQLFFQKLLKFLFLVVNLLLLIANIADMRFFDFESKRLTADIFTKEWLGDDFITLLPQFFIDFWYLFLFWVVFGIFLYVLYPKLNKNKLFDSKLKFHNAVLQSIVYILLLGLCIIGARGGLQLKPLRVIHAAKYTEAKNIPLVLNSPFTIMKTLGSKKVNTFNYFRPESLDSIYSPIVHVHPVKENKTNIVVIILESFSNEYIGAISNKKSYTPFLDSLINHSLVFTNAYANGKRSIESMPSIFAGIPALTDIAFITSNYSSNNINSAAGLLASQGYHTSFFHGGKNGTMGFNDFARLAGFDEYYGMTEYNNPDDYDGKWGIYDEEFLQFFKRKIDGFEQPFLTSVYTLTSHHPYKVPEKYKNRFPKGTLVIHESIGYTDFALQKFFERIKNTDWYKNTLFIITSDHTAQAESDYYNTKPGSYAIPIILFHPNDTSLIGKSNIIAQQTDIFPTIMDYIGFDNQFIAYGNSLLNDSFDHFAINYISGIYQLIQHNYVIHFDGIKTIAIYKYPEDSLLTTNLVNKIPQQIVLENKAKAIIQSYNSRLDQNKLIFSDKNQ